MEIKLLKFKEYKAGALEGFADIEFYGMTIKCRIMNGSNGRFVGLPNEKSQKDSKYYPLCRFEDKNASAEFNALVLALIDGKEEKKEVVDPQDISWEE